MSKSGANTPVIQDAFLNEIRKQGIPVTIFLVNGFQLKGTIKSFDNFTVMLESDERQMLVYKHAISTVIPSRPVLAKHGEETAKETGEGIEEETRGK
ncbi:MAG: RNA chaperone Hfq [Firmicutes bacterium]|nr:RNA chaperone Hfq [Candidatus Fermentithermobacillaceae bacterium]